MNTSPVMQAFEDDCGVLLSRALFAKDVAAFGADGLGQHGRHNQPQFFMIENLDVIIQGTNKHNASGEVALQLTGYDANVSGHIYTDRNFLIRIRELLQQQAIDPSIIRYGKLDLQGEDYVSLEFDVGLLLGWV